MKMYANESSFVANLPLETRNSFREVSFSSYLNKTEENMVRKLANPASELPNDHHYRVKPEDDEEIDVFGAEKYFKGEIEGEVNQNDLRFIDTSDPTTKMDQKIEEFDNNSSTKLRGEQTIVHTPSVRSNASCNSRNGLLPRNKDSTRKVENGSKSRTFLARFGCNCMNKKSTLISETQFIHSNTKTGSDFDQKTERLLDKTKEKKPRNQYFSFPVLNSNSNDPNSVSNSSSNSKSGNLAGKVVKVDNNNNSNNNSNSNNNIGGRLSIGRKISLLSDLEDEMYNSSSRMYNNEVDSDSSSDLFEIESFSPTGDSSCLGQRKSNCYAPSEVSIEWSVVTASAADFSVVSDFEDVRTGGGGGGWRNSSGSGRVRVKDSKDEQRKRSGILSGCTSYKAVRVAGDERKVGGGEAGGRTRLSDSTAVGSVFRGGMI
ncbi:putative protein PHYTOCHROME KINASE SUBSTRATE [Helianthus annuus]|nr:putative protein PHYTOCHROME KINASE SUBSTRATE [Helianthus annuus]KAJ0545112.1 putative protein PHYTOCHROME KINASE SUBSTRATE [Helianthus annuus]KAJ0717834.1 putative protein PHYTOCHROME KINASE SUBSTRATE [Helianthus annuus]